MARTGGGRGWVRGAEARSRGIRRWWWRLWFWKGRSGGEEGFRGGGRSGRERERVVGSGREGELFDVGEG